MCVSNLNSSKYQKVQDIFNPYHLTTHPPNKTSLLVPNSKTRLTVKTGTSYGLVTAVKSSPKSSQNTLITPLDPTNTLPSLQNTQWKTTKPFRPQTTQPDSKTSKPTPTLVGFTKPVVQSVPLHTLSPTAEPKKSSSISVSII